MGIRAASCILLLCASVMQSALFRFLQEAALSVLRIFLVMYTFILLSVRHESVISLLFNLQQIFQSHLIQLSQIFIPSGINIHFTGDEL